MKSRDYRCGTIGKMQPYNRGATCLTSLGETVTIPSSVVTSLGLRVGHEIEFETYITNEGLMARRVRILPLATHAREHQLPGGIVGGQT